MCKNTRPIQLIFQQLPSEFTRQDLMRLLKRHHRTLPIEEVLYRFKRPRLHPPLIKSQPLFQNHLKLRTLCTIFN